MTQPTLLLTRPLAQSRAFLADLTGAIGRAPQCIISPTTRITHQTLLQQPRSAQALLFTSPNGVESFALQTTDRTIPAFCVGPTTFATATHHGFSAQNANGDGHDLLRLTLSKTNPENGPIIYISGNHAALDLAVALRTHGYKTTRQILYTQSPESLSATALTALQNTATVVPLFSPRSATNLKTALANGPPARATFVCISENAAKPLRDWANPIEIAAKPNRAAMIAALTHLI